MESYATRLLGTEGLKEAGTADTVKGKYICFRQTHRSLLIMMCMSLIDSLHRIQPGGLCS